MKIVNLRANTPEWHTHREKFDNASDAPAMMGCSPFKTRSQFLRERSTGIKPDVGPEQQRRFDDGHRFEALARPLAEEIVAEELYPCVGVAGNLSASFDGLTLGGETNFEHKSLNEELRAILPYDDGALMIEPLPLHYRCQMEHQMMVSGAEKTLFMASKWNGEELVEERHCWYYPDLELRAKIVAGWRQFHRDLEAYVPTAEAEPAPVGKAPETLPALRIEVTGAVTASNLAEFKQTALSAIRGVNRDLKTDADFADADKAVKWCSDVESRLKAAKEHALSQTADIDALFKTLDDIATEARTVRLDLDKLVTKRKTEVKEQAVLAARKALDAHVAKLNGELAPMGLHLITADFDGAIKGLRSIASMQDALDTTLANAKIEADAQAAAMRHNINVFKAAAAGYEFLFADLHVIVHKAAEDFALLVDSRVAAHKAAEQERKEAEEAARQKAEAERLEREAEAKREFDKEVAIRIAADLAPPPVAPTVTPRLRNLMAATMAIAGPHALEMPDISAEHFADDSYSNDKQPAAIPLPDQSPATLKLDEICAMFGVTMTAAFVADTLGVPHRATDKAAKLYRQSDVALIGRALQRHIGRAIELQAV